MTEGYPAIIYLAYFRVSGNGPGAVEEGITNIGETRRGYDIQRGRRGGDRR